MPKGSGLSFLTSSGGGVYWDNNTLLGDHVAVYVDDYFGGKVIKQEATKVVIIDKNGKTTEAFSKQKPDKGYSYKLVRL
jgi:hypothetical protein